MIKIGIVGCGSIAIKRHIPEFNANPKCQIAGYLNPSKERCYELAKQYGGTVFQSLEELLADSSIDAVCICAPNKFHAEMAIQALKAGKHVLCEKPIATSILEAESMVGAFKNSKYCLMIAHDMKYSPFNQKAKEIIQSGRMGTVLSFSTSFGHGGPENWSVDKSLNSWFFRKDAGINGVLGDLGIHKVHLISWLLDEKISEVSAFSETRDKRKCNGEQISVDDNCVCIMKTESGIIGTMTASWTYYDELDMSTIIHCSNGSIHIYEDEKNPLYVKMNNGEMQCFEDVDSNNSGVADAFIRNIESNYSPEIETCEGYNALKVIEACVQSIKQSKVIKIV